MSIVLMGLPVLLAGGLVTALVALYRARSARARDIAETKNLEVSTTTAALTAISQAAGVMYESMTLQLGDMRQRLAAAESELAELRAIVKGLR